MVAFTLSKNHAWLVLLNLRIEKLCKQWHDTLPQEEADEKIDAFMEYCKCLRQKYVHRSNYYRIVSIVDAQLRE